MANNLLTLDMITERAIMLFQDTNFLIKNANRQYEDYYANRGAKIGDTLRIRLPNDFTVREGQAAAPQSTNEQYTTLTLAYQDGVDLAYSSEDLTLSLDDYSDRILAPAMNNLAAKVATRIMAGAEKVCNFTSLVDGSGNITTPDMTTWLSAGAYLDDVPTPRGDRMGVLSPLSMARAVSTMTGLFNPTGTISEQFLSGEVYGPALGVGRWGADQTVILHTTGAYGTPTNVNGANQTGSSVTVVALNGPLKQGDIITLPGCYQVNRITKQSTGRLQQFVVTADCATGATSIPIYPSIVPPAAGNPVQYQTVTASPTTGQPWACVSKASEVYRKNLILRPEALTIGSADLIMPKGVHEAARVSQDGLSFRMVSQYLVGTDQFITRLDFLYGYQWVRPEWAMVVADKV